MKILLVDDKSSVLTKLTPLLEQQGCDVDTAMNGLSAFELNHNKEYDLFIIDHLMPLMDGIKLVKNLRQQPSTQHVPIIFMSTQDLKDVANLFDTHLVDHLIAKPIDIDQLSQLIRHYQNQNRVSVTL